MLKLYYNDVEITDRVTITAAVGRDVSGGCCDSLELSFQNADKWYAWSPKTDDRIRMERDGYSTGTMYESTICPDGNTYAMMSTAIPSKARKRRYNGYSGMTLGTVMNSCGIECGMGYKIYGVPTDVKYRYLTRNNESCAAFLERICRMEGAVLKCWNGKFVCISVTAAQKLAAAQRVSITSETEGVSYHRQENRKLSRISIVTPYAKAIACDSAVETENELVITDVPAMNNAEAYRWAKGLLLMHNRQCEVLTFRTMMNEGFTAMARIDVTGGTDADGEWIIDEAVNDLLNGKSEIRMLRCIDTIR